MSEPETPVPLESASSEQRSSTKKRSFLWLKLICAFLVIVMIGVGAAAAIVGPDVMANLLSPVLVEVKGKVTYNGKPLTGGFIQTLYERPTHMGALGAIDEKGAFQLRTNMVPGAFSGKHKVIVRWMDTSVPPRDLLPSRYTSEETTPLTIQILRSGMQDIELQLVDDPKQ